MKYRAGKLEDGIFKVWINSNQIFRIVGNCAGILEETIKDLFLNKNFKTIAITVTDGPFKGVYEYTREQTSLFRIWSNKKINGADAQRLFPLRENYLK